jgi:hypothetical protein
MSTQGYTYVAVLVLVGNYQEVIFLGTFQYLPGKKLCILKNVILFLGPARVSQFF